MPREYQYREMIKPLQQGIRRIVAVWHRRAGKDSTVLNYTVGEALEGRIGIYWHMLPTLNQGRKVIWEGMTRDGLKVMEAWPEEAITGRRNDEMKLELASGSIWQVVGSDNYNSLVGSNPVGVVMSEYSVADPAAWDFIRPILAENNGWAVFPYTPRGRNHGYDLYQMAKGHKDWHASVLTADDTGVISAEAIQAERDAGMADEMVEQEFFCSFDAPLTGAYYSKQMTLMMRDKRITKVPHDPALPVETWWDLGVNDSTTIGFIQRHGKAIHAIDYYENSGEAMAHYAGVLRQKEAQDYVWSDHVFPHDADAKSLQTGKTIKQIMKELGFNIRVLPRPTDIRPGIDQTRAMLPRIWMDEIKCARWIEALKQYQKEWDDKKKVFKDRPLHDWTSHPADMTRVGATFSPKLKRKGASPQPEYRVY